MFDKTQYGGVMVKFSEEYKNAMRRRLLDAMAQVSVDEDMKNQYADVVTTGAGAFIHSMEEREDGSIHFMRRAVDINQPSASGDHAQKCVKTTDPAVVAKYAEMGITTAFQLTQYNKQQRAEPDRIAKITREMCK
jgi:hypothetical protein